MSAFHMDLLMQDMAIKGWRVWCKYLTFHTPYIPSVSPTIMGLFLSVPLLATSVTRSYTIIIPLHNKADMIRPALLSAINQSKKPREILVVDDKSIDDSLSMIEDLKDHYTLIRNEENIGKAKSINKALEKVKTPYVLVLDADTILKEDFAEKVMRGFTSKEIVGTTGVVLPTSIKTRTEKARLIEYLLGSSHKKTQVKIGGMWTLAGCSMMWKTDKLKEMEGIPEESIVEDMEASWKAQSMGDENGKAYSLSYVSTAIAYTDEPKTFDSYVKQIDRWFSIRGVIKRNINKIKKRLWITLGWSLLEAMLPLVFIALVAYLLLGRADFISAGILLAVDALSLLVLSLHLGKKYNYGVKIVASSVVWFWMYRFINTGKFWQRLLFPKKEW
ncbi:MAG: glycosyltransferase family 2 protein [Caldisphaeraceae archaeon]|nr:glycosyltransferase family 2 protein [Caldisphaeraceae archaeon]